MYLGSDTTPVQFGLGPVTLIPEQVGAEIHLLCILQVSGYLALLDI